MKFLGVALLLLGGFAVFYGRIGYDQQTTMMEVGGIKATTTEQKTLPIAGIVTLFGGVAMLLIPRRQLG